MLVRAVLINLLLLNVVISAPEKAEGLSCKEGKTTSLHKAVSNRDIDAVEKLMEETDEEEDACLIGEVLNLNRMDDKGRTPIAIAVELADLEVVKVLLSAGIYSGTNSDQVDLVRVDVLSLNNKLQNEEKNRAKDNNGSSAIDKEERRLSDIRDEIRMRIERKHFLRIVSTRDFKRITSLFEKGIDSKNGILLKKGGFDINYRLYGTTDTALHIVMYSSHDREGKDFMVKPFPVSSQDFIKLLEYLLDKGADMNARSGGETPLMRCKALIGRGSEVSSLYYKYFPRDLKTLMSSPCADVITVFAKRPEFKIENARPEDKWVSSWMLGVLAEVNRLETIKFLLEKKGLKINKDILSYISRRTSKKTLEYLFKKGSGIELNLRSYLPYEWESEYGDSVLHYLVGTASARWSGTWEGPSSSRLNDPEIIKLLKDRGEYVDTKETIKFLIEKGADVNIKNYSGNTPLLYTLLNGPCFADVAKKIIENGVLPLEKYRLLYGIHGPNSNCREKIFNLLTEGLTPLHIASSEHDLKEVMSLIARGSDINIQAKDGYTPLHLAVISSIERYDDSNGNYYKSTTGPLGILEFLMKKGADINIQGKDGHTPLHLAVIRSIEGHYDDGNRHKSIAELLKILEFLMKKGADINIKNKTGKTPLHLAVITSIGRYDDSNQHPSIIEKILKLLIRKGADTNTEDKDGKTAISYTIDKNTKYCGRHRFAIIKGLIENGEKVNYKSLSLPLLHEVSKRERAWRIKQGYNYKRFKNRTVQTECDKIIELVEKKLISNKQ